MVNGENGKGQKAEGKGLVAAFPYQRINLHFLVN